MKKKYSFLIFVFLMLNACQETNLETNRLSLKETNLETNRLSLKEINLIDNNFSTGAIMEIVSYDNYLLLHYQQGAENCIYRMNIKTTEFKQLFCTDDEMTGFDVDIKGDIYVGTKKNGIYVADLEGNLLDNYNTTNSCMLSNYISCLAVDESGSIYFGNLILKDPNLELAYYEGFGLIKLNTDNLSCEIWDTNNSEIPGNAILDIEIKDDVLWFSTLERRMAFRIDWENLTNSGGLCKMKNGSFQIYNKDNVPELLSLLIYDIQIGPLDNVWFENIIRPYEHRSYNRSSLLEITADNQVSEIGKPSNITGFHLSLEDRSGNKILHGSTRETVGYAQYSSSLFFCRLLEGKMIDYSDQLQNHYSSMAIDKYDQLWLGGSTILTMVEFID